MEDIKNFLELLQRGLIILSTYKGIIEIGPKLINLGAGINTRKYYDIDEILPSVIEKKINLGDIIECSGFLTKYSQTFLPMSFEYLIPGVASEKPKSFQIIKG